MAIRDWPEEERPREKLLAKGAANLSSAELLAILLRTGNRGKSAVDLARDLLQRFGGLGSLFTASLEEFSQVAGMGPSKYVQLRAVLELGQRALQEQLTQRDALGSPHAMRDYLKLHFRGLEREVFVCVYLDMQNRLIQIEELFAGTLGQTSVYPREVVKQALRANAANVIFAHNHPSGVTEPSEADRLLTRRLKQALELVDIRVLDHFIVAGGETLSFAQRGLL
jgi:DNA repair protein RadC